MKNVIYRYRDCGILHNGPVVGEVVNDSLLLIDLANRNFRSGISPIEAVYKAGIQHFRQIILTSLTTFGGVMPMILEKYREAQMMVPMPISLVFGVLFATFITLVMIPLLYLILDDFARLRDRKKISDDTGEKTGPGLAT